jgi:hypothetical protein
MTPNDQRTAAMVACPGATIVDLTNANECERYERPLIRYFAELWFRSTITISVLSLDIRHPLNLMRNGSAAESSQMIHATQDSSRPQFWHRKKNGSREALAVYDPNISAKSIAGKVAIGSVTS